MPAFELRTVRKTQGADSAKGANSKGANSRSSWGARLAAIRTAAATVAADILRGPAPAPVLQPIPVRVRRQRRS